MAGVLEAPAGLGARVPAAAIEAEGLVKSFRAKHVLRGACLSIAPGEAVALTGPNGAGKTTLLRILATTLRPDGGRARVGGCDVVSDPAGARAHLGLLPAEDRAWHARVSLERNLLFYASVYGLRRRAARERVAEVLGAVGLADASNVEARDASSGMRHRLALARALLADRGVLLLDEPGRSLDPHGRAALHDLIRGRLATGTAALVVTHDVTDAEAVGARVAALRDGVVTWA